MVELSPSATLKSSIPMADNSRLQQRLTWQANPDLLEKAVAPGLAAARRMSAKFNGEHSNGHTLCVTHDQENPTQTTIFWTTLVK
jgi:hypothetical protein